MNHVGTKRLETERIVLRPFRPEDAQAMYDNWASDEEVTRFLTWPTHESVEVTRAIVEEWSHLPPERYEWCLEIAGQPMGSLGVVSADEETGTLEIGYCLSRKCWGKGYMPEAVRAVIDFLFDTVGAKRIIAKHDVENPKSGRVMEKCGMAYLETRRAGVVNHLGTRDVVVRFIDNPRG